MTTSVGSPALVIDLRALKIEEVGLTANLATISCPVDMPPRIPPAWLEEYFGFPLSPINISSAFSEPANILNPQINFTDESNGHINGVWNFDDGTTQFTNFDQISHIYSDTGTYQVTLTVETDSGCIDIASQTIYISPVFTIYVPNAFTPNNDLNNDYFLPIVDGVSEYELSIYNSHGQRIFTTNEYSNDYLSCVSSSSCLAAWDGKIKNGSEYATKGAYVYAIILKDFNGKTRTYEGSVVLLR